MSYSTVITYDSATSLSFNSSLVQISGGHLTLVPVYSTSNPLVTSGHENTISSLASFSESATTPASTAIGYQLVLNSNIYWYNAVDAKWEASDGTYSQSNTASVINAHASSLFSDLALIVPQFLSLRIFLHTSNPANAPSLTSNTLGYSWVEQTPAFINLCNITGNLADLIGVPVARTSFFDSTAPTFTISAAAGFMHSGTFIQPFTKTFIFGVDGTLSAEVIETATPGVKLNFVVNYYDGKSIRSTRFFPAIVPNQPQILLSNLSSPLTTDFG